MSPIEVLTSDDTLRGYDRWAVRYDGGDNPMIAATEWAFDARPIAWKGMGVIELACGTGRNARRALDGGARAYVGVDGSRGMLDLARARVDDARCTWVHAEMTAPPAGLHDVALIVLALEHVADLTPVFAAVARVLRPGGSLRVLEIHPELVASGTVAHFYDPASDREVRFTSTAHPIASMRAAIEAAGFAIERLDEDVADGAFLDAVPKLAKHRGRRVLVDLLARL
jgi:ubiquinone/menaquinone biosynthesis C-methylase UbiE